MVEFQKNENHYNAKAPGNFSLYGWNNDSRSPLQASAAAVWIGS